MPKDAEPVVAGNDRSGNGAGTVLAPKGTHRAHVKEDSGSGSPAPWAALRHTTFTVLWGATIISNLGSYVSAAASGWLMTTLNPDPLVVSLVQVATNLPLFVLTLPAGVLTDMIDYRKFLIASELAIMGCGTVLAILVSTHLITAGSLIVMTALISAAVAIGVPAWQAAVSDVVPRPELASAISLGNLGINVSRAVGPALGGFLVGAYGFVPPFWIDAFSNAGVIGALLWWKHPDRKSRPPREAFASAMMVGLRHALYNPHMSATLARSSAFFLFASAYWALLPIVARTQVAGGPAFYGVLLGAIGAGAILGALLLAFIPRHWGPDKLVAGCCGGTALALISFAESHDPGIAIATGVLAGVFWMGAVSMLILSAQVALPEWVRGRGMAVFITVMFGALSLGGLIWGKLATEAGVSTSLLVAAAGAAVAIPLTWRQKLQTGARVDFTPAGHWPTPLTTRRVEGDRGPVLVTVEYRIDIENRLPFLTLLFQLSSERKRDGAYRWRVFEDPAVEGRFLEMFLTDSWREHLLHHARITNTDRLREEALKLCVTGHAPVTTHFIQMHRADSVETAAPTHAHSGSVLGA